MCVLQHQLGFNEGSGHFDVISLCTPVEAGLVVISDRMTKTRIDLQGGHDHR
jgi:hypothetical protein